MFDGKNLFIKKPINIDKNVLMPDTKAIRRLLNIPILIFFIPYAMATGAPDGTPIRAAADGIVSYSGLMEGYGNVVIINNGNGISTLYAHNEKLLVVVGQRVSKGEVIAYSGHIGWATGPHCHFGVYVNGIPVNPLLYLK
ncbi:M23 family metallopeptidase [Thermoanaerobacterium sp. R66]|uniref:M23 family metallopeptidase n=1 Tax=Thermoanaerobacterium sp. R66 TaxID=2742479 RepID=UPI00237FEE36|nr:M23 family metallopeptidase [Thermoanaerobacterium sp. R66]